MKLSSEKISPMTLAAQKEGFNSEKKRINLYRKYKMIISNEAGDTLGISKMYNLILDHF